MKRLVEYIAIVHEEMDPVHTILGVASLISKRESNSGKPAKLSMLAFLNMLQNAGLNVSYETFKGVFDQSSELKNAIQQFNDHEITFITPGTAVDSEYEEPSGDQPPEEKVDQMAKRASNKRI